ATSATKSALSGHAATVRYLSAFGAKRTTGLRASPFSKRDQRPAVISAVFEDDARYVVQSGGAANGGPERWNSTHMCHCSSPLARLAPALVAWPRATARQASPSRRVRAQRQR